MVIALIKRALRSSLFYVLPKPKMKNAFETVNYIVKNRCSVSRYGDGEFNLIMNNAPLYFQQGNHALTERLKEVLKTKIKNHIVCIPYTLISRRNLSPDSAFPFWNTYWKYNYRKLYRYFNFSMTYFDSLVSRPYIDLTDKSGSERHFTQLKKIFVGQDIFIVEGSKSRSGVGNDLFEHAKSVKRIICPADNAYSVYGNIMEVLQTKIPKNCLILICLGPTATVLAYDLAKTGYWAIDLGHIDMEYEWFLMGATAKVPIENKIVREGDIHVDLVNEDNYYEVTYRESIVCQIF